MIKKLYYNSRNAEINDVGSRIMLGYKQSDLQEDSYLSDIMGLIETSHAKLTSAIGRGKVKSDLQEKDKQRDDRLRSLHYLLLGNSHHPNATIKAAADKVLAVFDHYGMSLIQESYSTESSYIRSMLEDLNNPVLNQSIALLSGCAELIGMVKLAQDEFENARIEHDSRKVVVRETEIKRELMTLINGKLVVYLRAMEEVNTKKYRPFANLVAIIIDENNEMIKKRKGKSRLVVDLPGGD